MELVFNLLWLMLSTALVAGWLFGARSLQKKDRGNAQRLQIVALAMLIIILLPVVSLTDDLQACATPAETEHLGRRIDQLAAMEGALDHVLMVVTPFTGLAIPVPSSIRTAECPVVQVEKPCAGYLRRLVNRPPPLA